ncbi:MAG: bifunctional homocysteine S-methyltransferase/methylenetetrahydrofolate reductase [Clostridia bacterium]|jgi:homocysteine S-methyltransferase|nr:bifunctional homocysteine S-methyltransferase/methylenetetrahydrofolate reductase [Clostridia bacterium]
MENIRDYIKNNILVFDGGMGTYFASKYKTMLERCENVNLSDPMKIFAIHKEYIDAGCHAIKTNTFAANIESLGNEKLLEEVIKSGWNLAQSAAKDRNVYVFADIGHIQESEEEDVAVKYIKNADIFLSCGAENFLFETLSNDNGIYETAEHIKKKNPNAFILVSFAVFPDGYTKDGSLGYELLSNADKCQYIDALGLNCVSGPHHMYEYFKRLKEFSKPMSVMPNAGYPTVINNRTFFESSPDYFAIKMKDIVSKGAQIIGGCCGTTPDHIKKTIEALIYNEPQTDESTYNQKLETTHIYLPNFNKKLNAGMKVIVVELDPPENADISKFLKNVLLLKNSGIDLMTIADCPIAKARADSSLLACKIKREFDFDVMPHITCRDRNINATKALLLGLNIEDIRNVLIVTGDPIPTAQRDEVKSVFNFNSRMLAKYMKTLNETVFADGFNIFGALNVNARNFDIQLNIAKEKEQNGIIGFLTQPVMTEYALKNLKRAKSELKGKILAGIMPIMSYRNACFMDSEISGINVDKKIIRLFYGKNKEESADLGIKIAIETAEKVKDISDGYYLMTPFSRADIICRIVEEIKKI